MTSCRPSKTTKADLMSRVKSLSAPPYFKTGLVKQKRHRIIDAGHLAFVRTLPCLACGGPAGTAHHLTIGRGRMGRKAGDDQAVPLTERCHNMHPESLHVVGEKVFWNRYGIDPRPVAAALYGSSGDFEKCLRIIRSAQESGAVNRARGVMLFETRSR